MTFTRDVKRFPLSSLSLLLLISSFDCHHSTILAWNPYSYPYLSSYSSSSSPVLTWQKDKTTVVVQMRSGKSVGRPVRKPVTTSPKSVRWCVEKGVNVNMDTSMRIGRASGEWTALGIDQMIEIKLEPNPLNLGAWLLTFHYNTQYNIYSA